MSRASHKFTKEIVLEAVRGSGSIYSTIAKRLRCDWRTARAWVSRWEETRNAYESETETVLDLCESKLIESIQNGNTQDARWLLSTKGKDRGYSQRQELEHGGSIESTIIDVRFLE